MSTYTSINGMFTYTITNNSSYVFEPLDYAIIQSAFDRWDNIVTLDPRLEADYTITISYSVDVLEVGILGGASLQTVGYIDSQTFGNTFPYEAEITLNATYLSGMKNAVRADGKTSYYYVLLHEIGHILGIGSLWDLPGTPKVSYLDNGVTKYYYTGANALREYKSYFSANGSSSFVGVPIEDNGGAGTVNVHPEEGPEGGVSADNRYINGIFHPGLDTELMTGWLDSAPVSTPLSRITLGFLADMGYTVNYNLADIYTMAAESGTSSIDWTSPTETILQASNFSASAYFGGSVAISGNYAIVGADYESSSGAAYIFERNDSGNWIQEPIVRSSNLDANDRFGRSVAISGNYAIVGAEGEAGPSNSTIFSGAAYIFERNDSGNWIQNPNILRASNLGEEDQFGYSVAISGKYAIVGAWKESGAGNGTAYSGAAYIFERNGSGNWIQNPNILRASNLDAEDRFGRSVAISGNYAIVGATGEAGASNGTAGSGAAYIFEHDGSGNWIQKPILRASNLDANDSFGISVSISGNYAIVGANREDENNTSATFNSGAAYIFERDGSGNWIQNPTILRASNFGQGDEFGRSVSISGNYAIVGAWYEDSTNTSANFNSGAAYIFERNSSGVWNETKILRASNLQSYDLFGNAVAISGLNVIVGAYTIGSAVGGAYIYTGVIPPPPSMTITSTSGVTSGSTTNNATIALTFTSSESTTDFVVEDISVINGALSPLTTTDNTVYTATFTPNGQGPVACTISVAANKFTSAGQNNTASNTFTFIFDAAPTMAITSTTVANNATTNVQPINLTFTASEAITGFTKDDISFNNGTLSDLTVSSATVYTATFTQAGDGAYTINVPVGAFADASGNNNTTASSFNWTYDSVPPTMTITSTTLGVTSGSTTNNETIALTFTSSKPTTNFLVGDISFNKGTLAGFAGSVTEGTEGTVYTATFTQGGQGAHIINVPVGAYSDAAGNSNTDAAVFNWNYDSVSPSMDISATTIGVTRGSTTKTTPIVLTFTSTEATNNFALEDISVTNGTLTDFAAISGTDGKVYTATFTPTGPGPVACTIDVLAGAYTDAATNLNNLATQFAFTFDSVPPTMTITSTTAGVTSGSTINNPPIALTFTSSKATTNFAVGDISVTNGTISAFASSSPTVYSATFAPTGQGACTIGVASGAYTDAAGNNNSSANTFSVSYIPNFASFNDANNLEQTYIAGFLDVSGTINHRSGDLNVMDGNLIVSSGDAHFNNGNLYVGGNVVFNSGLNVSGATTLGRVSVSQTIDVSGATTLVGGLTITDITSFNDNVTVSGNKTFTVGSGATRMGGNATMNSTMSVGGSVSMNSGLRVAGATTLANAIMGGPVSVSGRVVFLNDISFTGPNVDICGNLRAQYPANSIPAAAIIGGISVVSLFDTDVSLSETLSVGGATSLSTLTATGNATLRSTVGIVGATTMSALTTGGATTFGGALSVVGKAALTNDVSFNGSRIDITGNLYANYPANSIPASAVVGGGVNPVFMTDVSINAALSTAGATTLKSTLVVTGQTILANDVLFDISYSRIDICGNLYANYPANSIPSSAIIGGTTVASVFNTDVSMNSRLYVKESIKIGNLATLQPFPTWYQDGGTIVAEATNGAIATDSVSMSADGSIIAIGCVNNDGTTTNAGDNRGSVRVYQRDATNTTIEPIGWKQLGGDIDGEAAGNNSGRWVSLSSNGLVIAISATSNAGAAGVNSGHVRVYERDLSNTTLAPIGWKQLGGDIDGKTSGTFTGTSVSLSENGLVVAIGSALTDAGGISSDNNGSFSWYERNTSNTTIAPIGWTQIGSDINGLGVGHQFGNSVSLSANGNIVAVGTGAPSSSTTPGYVCVYQRSGQTVTQLGSNITGQANGDQFGNSVSLSSDGTIVAIGADVNGSTRGNVSVYRFTGSWTKLGGDILGESTSSYSGQSVSLSANWPNVIVAIGAPRSAKTGLATAGYAIVYKYDATKATANTNQLSPSYGPAGWNIYGSIIDGVASNERLGTRLALSTNGSTLAVIGSNTTYAANVYKLGNSRLSTDVLSTSGLQTSGIVTISGPLAVTGATTLSSLATSGATTLNPLTVTGATTLSTMTTTSNATIGGALLVTGTSSMGVVTMNSTLSVGAATTMSARLIVNSDVSLNNRLTVSAATTMNSTLTVAGATTINNNAVMASLATAGAVTTNTTLYVAKSVTMNGDLDTTGVLLMSGVSVPTTLVAAGAVTMSSVLSVGGAATMRSTLNTTGAVTIGGILSVAGVTTMSGLSTMNTKLSVGSDVIMNSALTVVNSATLASTLAVVGATTFSSTLYTSGSTTINNTLNVTGKATFLNDVSFNNNVSVTNALKMNNNRIAVGSSNIQYNDGVGVDSAVIPSGMHTTNNTTVGGVLAISGGTVLLSTLDVGGAATAGTMYASSNAILGSTLSVAGAATVGPLTVSGATTVSTITTSGATTVGGTLGISGAATMTTLNVYGPVRQW